MNIIAHIEALSEKHAELKAKIENAYIHHLPSDELQRLKKKKLKIKDQIEELSKQMQKNRTRFRKAA